LVVHVEEIREAPGRPDLTIATTHKKQALPGMQAARDQSGVTPMASIMRRARALR